MKLRKKDRALIERALSYVERGRAFLMSDRTLLCRRRSAATTTLDLTNAQGDICYAIDKEIGSDLAMLHTGIAMLRKALDEEVQS